MNLCWNLWSLLVHAFARPIRGPRSSSPPILTFPQWAVVLQRSLPPQQPSRVLRMLGYWSIEMTCGVKRLPVDLPKNPWNTMEGSIAELQVHVFVDFHTVSYVLLSHFEAYYRHVAWMPRTPSLQTPPLRPRTPRPQRPPAKRRRHKQKQPQSKQRKASCPGFRGMGPEISRGEFVIRLGIKDILTWKKYEKWRCLRLVLNT